MRKKILGASALLCLLLAICSLSASAEATLSSARTTLRGASKNKKHNITLAIQAIDGITVTGDGGFFSFNDAVGPRTSSYGYKNAPNGRGVKVTGGGVAQVASTLYIALKDLDGISYDEVETYSTFTDNYVASEKDAILVDYKAGTDFSFYNDTGSSLRIDMWVSDDYVHCALVADSEVSGDESSAPGYASIGVSGSSALTDNIILAADSIYDTTLSHGDEFSFNSVVGPRTERYGYKAAINGRGVKTVGGGVAQVASCLYMAVKSLPSVTVLEKSVYKDYNQHYVKNASDAISVDYQDEIDFAFRYDGYDTLTIYTYVSGNTLYCEAVEN